LRENEIDEEVLPGLTADDLKDLGVALVGHRHRLLDAIAALGAATPPAVAPCVGMDISHRIKRRASGTAILDPIGPAELRKRQSVREPAGDQRAEGSPQLV
jgi:hypothetical protein